MLPAAKAAIRAAPSQASWSMLKVKRARPEIDFEGVGIGAQIVGVVAAAVPDGLRRCGSRRGEIPAPPFTKVVPLPAVHLHRIAGIGREIGRRTFPEAAMSAIMKVCGAAELLVIVAFVGADIAAIGHDRIFDRVVSCGRGAVDVPFMAVLQAECRGRARAGACCHA